MSKTTISDFDTSLNQTLSKTTRLAPRILLGLLLVSSIALLISAFSFERRLQDVHLANSDNTGWIIAQLEVDQQDLMLRLANVLPQDGVEQGNLVVSAVELQRIKQEFDILYSRITVFETALKRLLASDELVAEFENLKAIRQDLANEIDAIETPDVAPLLAFQTSVRETYPLVRNIAVAALQETVKHTATMRQQERSVFIIFLVQSIVLVALMVLSAFLAMRIWRDLEEKTAEKFRIGGLLSRAFDSTLNAVLVTDRHARILYSNPMAQNLFGNESASIVGLNINHVISLEDSKEPDDGATSGTFGVFGSLIDDGPKIVGSKRSDGKPIFVEMLLVRDKDIAGREVVICFVRDITDQVIAEEGLKDALRVAEQASSAKSAFLATMSHEMRTPLHGIMASLELMKGSELDPVNLNLLETAEACSHRALTQINNVLEMARLGQQYEAQSDLRPDLIAGDIVRELKPLADASRNTLELVVQGSFSSYRFEGLPYTFSQVLYNLVDNAIKFTEDGSVIVRLFLSDVHSGIATLFVEVADTGIGISEDAQNYIFEEFATADPNDITPKSGTGLGLSIAKRGVDIQGGELLLCSFPGDGSRFHFKVPLKAVPVEVISSPTLPEVPIGESSTETDGQTILIVDDSNVNLSLMREMLHRMGHEVDLAENGEVAVAKASERHYDAILMDFSMPVMDGPTAAEKIREMQTAPGQVVIIGVTALIDANADPRNRDLFDTILIKPVGQAQLATAIKEATAHQMSATPPAASPVPEIIADEIPDEPPAPFVPSDSVVETEDMTASTSFDEVMSLVGKDTAIRLLKTSFEDVELALTVMADDEMAVGDKAGPIHKSVGSTALLGLEDLSESLSEAEVMALSGTDPNTSELPKLIEALLKEAQIEFASLIAAHEKTDGGLAGSDA
ncbi:MAG: ATP-binding protein [Phaeobacter gallaeciensis]